MRKTCVVDCRIWKRGGGVWSSLLNGAGKMCCLGFFVLQFTELKPEDILDKNTPIGVEAGEIPYLTQKVGPSDYGEELYSNTSFSCSAMTINDDRGIDDRERKKQLRTLARRHGTAFRFTHQEK